MIDDSCETSLPSHQEIMEIEKSHLFSDSDELYRMLKREAKIAKENRILLSSAILYHSSKTELISEIAHCIYASVAIVKKVLEVLESRHYLEDEIIRNYQSDIKKIRDDSWILISTFHFYPEFIEEKRRQKKLKRR